MPFQTYPLIDDDRVFTQQCSQKSLLVKLCLVL